MPKKLLLLPSAKRKLLASPDPVWTLWLRRVAIAVGILMVVVGLADVTSRLAEATLGKDALFNAFAPAAAIKPSALPVPAASATSSALIPARLKIPVLGVDAKVEHVGTKEDGTMGTPQDFMNVAWWSEGARPGAAGNAAFAGHVNNALTSAGVFEHLSKIKKGDYITVSDTEGRTLVYDVESITLYEPEGAPLERIFATTGPSRLVLITCDGEWLADERSYSERLVVVAKPAY